MPRKSNKATNLAFIKGYLDRYKRELKEIRNLKKIAKGSSLKDYKEQTREINQRVKFLKNIENEIDLEMAKTIYKYKSDDSGLNIALTIYPNLSKTQDWLTAVTVLEYCEWKINKESNKT